MEPIENPQTQEAADAAQPAAAGAEQAQQAEEGPDPTTPPPAPAEAGLLQAIAQNPEAAQCLAEIAGGADPGECLERHFRRAQQPEPAKEPEEEPAMFRSSLDAPGTPRPFPTFLSNLSTSFWD